MKRSLLIILALILVFSVALVGCNNTTPPNGNEGGTNEGGNTEGGNEGDGPVNGDDPTEGGNPNEGGNTEGDGPVNGDDPTEGGNPNEGGNTEGDGPVNGDDPTEGGNPNEGGNEGGSTEGGDSDENIPPVDRGEMTVSGPSSIYSNYPARDITVSFTKDDYTELVEYTTSDARVFV